MKAFKVYPFVLASLASQTILADGSFVRVKTSTGDVSLTLDNIGPFGPVAAGQGFNLAANPDAVQKSFKRVTVSDMSGAANSGTIIVADATFVDQTIGGTVATMDGSGFRTRANAAFSAMATGSPGTATNNSSIQLWNQSTTTNLLVERVIAFGSQPSTFTLRLNQSAQSFPNACRSKLAGGADSVAAQTRASEGTVWTGSILMVLSAETANRPAVWEAKTPIVIPPGWGLTVHDNVIVAHSQTVSFEHVEQSVTS